MTTFYVTCIYINQNILKYNNLLGVVFFLHSLKTLTHFKIFYELPRIIFMNPLYIILYRV